MATEADVLAALRRRYAKPGNGGSGEYAFLTHVRNGAGFGADRVFDAVVLDLYPSRGLELHVIEVKVSRSDWLRELAEPEKAAAAEAVADRFWVATPKGLIQPHELRTGWGLIEVDGLRTRCKVKAQRIKRETQAIDRGLLIGMLRSAHGAVPGRSRWERGRWHRLHSDLYPELANDAEVQ